MCCTMYVNAMVSQKIPFSHCYDISILYYLQCLYTFNCLHQHLHLSAESTTNTTIFTSAVCFSYTEFRVSVSKSTTLCTSPACMLLATMPSTVTSTTAHIPQFLYIQLSAYEYRGSNSSLFVNCMFSLVC
jgi:hypothetical protein